MYPECAVQSDTGRREGDGQNRVGRGVWAPSGAARSADDAELSSLPRAIVSTDKAEEHPPDQVEQVPHGPISWPNSWPQAKWMGFTTGTRIRPRRSLEGPAIPFGPRPAPGGREAAAGNGQGFTAVSEASAAQCATARPIRTERYLDVRIIRRSCRGSDVNDTGCLRRAV